MLVMILSFTLTIIISASNASLRTPSYTKDSQSASVDDSSELCAAAPYYTTYIRILRVRLSTTPVSFALLLLV